MRRLAGLAVFFALLAAGPAVRPQGSDEVYVYTNADLERLEPYPPGQACCREDYGGWEFVTAFITQQYARLDADRKYHMDRRMNEVVTDDIEQRGQPRPVGAVWWGVPFRYGRHYRGGERRLHGAARLAAGTHSVPTNQPFTPFHASRSGGQITLTPRSDAARARVPTTNRVAASHRTRR